MKTVIEMAGEVDAVTKLLLDRKEPQGMSHDVFIWFLERFAELVRADERLACIEACWALELNDWEGRAECIDAIQARSET